MDNVQQQKVGQQVAEILDAEVNEFDDFTLARLKAARLNALEQGKSSGLLGRSNWLSRGALAGVLTVGFVALLQVSSPKSVTPASELALMAAMNPVLDEELELLEDLEFVAWLEQENLES